MASRFLKVAYVGTAVATSALIAAGVKSGRTQALDEQLTHGDTRLRALRSTNVSERDE